MVSKRQKSKDKHEVEYFCQDCVMGDCDSCGKPILGKAIKMETSKKTVLFHERCFEKLKDESINIK